MILSYIETMGPSLYDPKATDKPRITITGARLHQTRVWIAETEDPVEAPRKWWVNGKFYAENTRTIRIDGYLENFNIVIEKTNQFGTSREEIKLFFPRDDIGGSGGGAVGNDTRVVSLPDWMLPGGITDGAASYYAPTDITHTEWDKWRDIINDIQEG